MNDNHEPISETVDQWESRTGETYPDDGPVWRKDTLFDANGEYVTYTLTTWEDYKQSANHNGKPNTRQDAGKE